MKKIIARLYLIVPVSIVCLLQLLWINLFQTGNGHGSPLPAQLLLPVLFLTSVVLHFRPR